MSDHLPTPPVITIRPAEPGEDGTAAITCGCGTVTQLVIEGLEHLDQSRSLLFTCSSCQSVTWYAVGPAGEVPS